MTLQHQRKPNALHDLGYKIFLDRYAQKDMTRTTLAVGDTVIVVINGQTGQREIGKVTAINLPQVTIELNDGETVIRDLEHVDKPLETDPGQMMDRVAAGIAEIEATPELRQEWTDNFRWLLEDWKFVPGGRILTAAGTEQQLTLFNCFVLPSPRDSREGIMTTLTQMTEIMSRGGGVGINISSLRPRHAYVRGVNGRSSGAVSWGGLYSFVTGLIEQGGCFAGDVRISTDKGLLPARELAERLETGETFQADTHQGWRTITDKFRNGVKPVFEVETDRGYRVRITEDHKVAVLMDSQIVTMPLKYLHEGDEILLLMGQGTQADYVPLKPVVYERSIMSTTLNENVRFPTELTQELAYLAGYAYGDGYVHIGKKVNWQAPKALKLATADSHPEIRIRLINAIENIFGFTATIENGDGACKSVSIYSRMIVEWLIQNGLLKQKAEYVRVPEAIFRSPASVQGAFIAGYFDADGCNRGRKGGYGIDSISHGMLQDVQELLAANGILSRIGTTDRSEQGWQTIYRLTVVGANFKQRFAEFVPSAKVVQENNGVRDMNSIYPSALLKALGIRSKYRQRIYDGVSQNISFNQLEKIKTRLIEGGETALAQKLGETMRVMPDTIRTITPLGEAETFDFEVDDVHLLSGASVYTSNSRRGALMLILNDWHPDVFNFISSKRNAGQITNANISVGVSDAFMSALKADGDWTLMFPDTSDPDYNMLWDGDIDSWQALGKKVIVHKTIKAKEVWDAMIESAWASAEPGVWFRERSNKMSNSHYFSKLIATNPCGEQSLPAWAVCNLGAINLSNFYNEETKDVDWPLLDRTVRYATRFLDNIIDSTPYFFEQNRQTQQDERRVGLGTMGIAELMIKCQVRYGSDESVMFIDKVYKAIASAAYETSAQLAVEKGAFPQFDAEKFLQSGFMQGMPENIRKMVKECGIRNVTLLTQAPTGCVAPNTLISTGNGLQPIVNLGNPDGPQWQIMGRDVHTDQGLRKTSHFYINGRAAVKTLTTQRGFSLTATHNHRVRVIDALGEYVWRRMDEVQVGDKVVLKKNTLTHNSEVQLKSVIQGNRALSELPEVMTPAFSELLGLYMGDGYTKNRGGLHIVVGNQDPDLLFHVQSLMREVWGERATPIEERVGCSIVNLTGYYIPRFFEVNGMLKPAGNHGEGAAGAFIPEVVLQAGRDCVIAFLRGLYESDGCISRGTVTLNSTSLTLLQQTQIALLGLGIVTTLRQMPDQENRFGIRPFHELRVLNSRETERFVEVVGFISDRKQAKAQELGAMSHRGDNIAVPALLTEFYGQSNGLPTAVRQRITGLVSNGALTQQFVKDMVDTYPSLAQSRLGQLVEMDVFLDEIESLADGECDTYDISVPDNHTYIANGFVSHNTTGTMVNASTGVEPFFSWVYYRKSRLGLHEERMPIAQEWFDAHPGETQLPDYFVTAMELAPEDHIKVQAAFQRWVDSSISKTANTPNHYTVEQVGKLYEMMYDLGCKGGTIYRDGSRDEQVLMLKGDERAESEMADLKKKEVEKPVEKTEAPATPHRVYSRPTVLHGTTVSFKTPFGTSYITMNSDENGCPFEVFITVGKAGSDVQADAEALGRLISLQLRATAPQNRMEMLKLVIDQLQNIGGARPVGFGVQRVLSLPDAVARALEMHYVTAEEPPHQLALPGLNGNGKSKPVLQTIDPETIPIALNGHSHYDDKPVSMSGADMCPECGTISLVRAEGCRRCLTCEYTEC